MDAIHNDQETQRSRILQLLETAFPSLPGNSLAFDPRPIAYLETQGGNLYSGREDLVLFNIYNSIQTKTLKPLSTGDIVIPGTDTRRQHPETGQYGCHFRKTFSPDAPPLKRGETPEIETSRCRQIRDLYGRWLVEPLGYTDLTFRARAIPGPTIASLSPHSNQSYEDALDRPHRLPTEHLQQLAETLIDAEHTARELHGRGWCHGDLHLENVLATFTNPAAPQAQLIDLASAQPLPRDPALARSAIEDDLIEIRRELVLLQATSLGRIDHPVAAHALHQLTELFPDPIANRLAQLILKAPLHATRQTTAPKTTSACGKNKTGGNYSMAKGLFHTYNIVTILNMGQHLPKVTISGQIRAQSEQHGLQQLQKSLTDKLSKLGVSQVGIDKAKETRSPRVNPERPTWFELHAEVVQQERGTLRKGYTKTDLGKSGCSTDRLAMLLQQLYQKTKPAEKHQAQDIKLQPFVPAPERGR